MQHTPTKNRLPTRLTAWLLALLMVATMLPASALATAEDGSTDPPPPAAETELQTPVGADDSIRPDPSAGADDPIPPADPDPSAGADDPVPPADPDPSAGADDPVPSEPSAGADDPVPPETPADPETPLLTEEQTVSQPAMLAAGDKYGFVSFQFRHSGLKAIYLDSGQYINDCKGDTVPDTWQSTAEYPDIYDFIRNGPYKALHYQGFLYLKGELDLHGASINVDQLKLGFGISPKIQVQENASLYNSDSLIYSYDNSVEIFLPTGKTLALNAVRPGLGNQLYPGAIRASGEVTITGGGTLNIRYTLTNTESGITPRTLFGIYGGNGVTLRGNEYDGTGPTVNIEMYSSPFGPEANDVIGIWSGVGDLIIKDNSKVKIEVSGHKLGQKGTEEDVNRAITAQRMELLDNASLEIVSHKNVIHDIVLTGESGDVLTVNTTGFLNIRNKGDIQRYDAGTWQHLQFDYPQSNIHIKDSAKGASANIIKAEQGVKIESFSYYINKWYEKLNDPEQGNWNWAISGGADPALGTNMYRGNRRIDNLVKVDDRTTIYTWGSMEYIYSTTGAYTVQQTNVGKGSGGTLALQSAKFNDIYVVRGGEYLSFSAPSLPKASFRYWYDAQNPDATENGSTAWTSQTQKFSDIRRDMTLVPVYSPMKEQPTLGEYGYEKGGTVPNYVNYAYKNLYFSINGDIDDGSGGQYRYLIPARLPEQGEGIGAVKTLNGNECDFFKPARLYADRNAPTVSDDSVNNDWYKINEGKYRVAVYDRDKGIWYFSDPFELKLPLAPPYISPGSGISENSNSAPDTVTITAERGANIWYSQWDYTKNKWGGYNRYSGPFEVTVTAGQDMRIEAYAGAPVLNRRSEVRYAVRPTDAPTVKYGDTVISEDIAQRYFYGSIELTVEAPEGYEVWYQEDQVPAEVSNSAEVVGTKVENGKVVITDSGNSGKVYFKLAKAFTVNGREYRKLSHNYAAVHLTKLENLPTPKVTVKTKEGGTTLTPSGNTYTIKEFVNVALEKSSGWPLNATLGYAYHGDTAPQYAKPYTTPFEVRGAQTVSVFALASNADGSIAHHRWLYQFKLDPSVKNVLLMVGNATAYDSDGNVLTASGDVNVPIGTRIRVVPNVPSGKVFKNWSADGIYDTPSDKFKEELFFTMPDRSNDYNQLILRAVFADQSEASITGDTKVLLAMDKTEYNGNDVIMHGKAGDSVDLFILQSAGVDYHALRTISYQWWEGDSVGTVDNALPTWASFDKSKTYTVKVTITANEGVTFASTAGVQFGVRDGFLKMKDVTRSSDGKTLTFTATPLWTMNLPLPTLHDGDNLSGIEKSMNGQLMPLGYITDVRWESSTPSYAYTATTGTYYIEKLLLKPYSVSMLNRPLLDNKVVIGGTRYYHKSDENGNYVVVNYSASDRRRIPINVLPKGVTVSGTALSWNDTDNAVYLLYNGSTSDTDIKAEWKAGSYASGAALYTGTGGAISAKTVDGKAMQAQTFSFDTVAAGDYKLAIFKPGKYVPKIVSITVGTDAYDCGQLKLWLKGDVNGDGIVNGNDIQRLYSHITGASTLTDDDALIVANANEDTAINGNDIQRIFAHIVGSNIFSD